MLNSHVFKDGSLEIVGNARFVHTRSNIVAKLLIVDVHFNIWKNWVQIVDYMSNEMNWCLLRRLLFFRFYLLFVLLFFLVCYCKFRNHDPDKFQFQSRVRLSQINVTVPIPLKLKLYATFIEWGFRIDFLFKGQQNIVNYWDFPSKTSRNCRKRLVPKTTRKD